LWDCGAVFSLEPATGAKQVIHSFAGGEGDFPGPIS
jgi:hypothetical protein